MKKTVKNTKEIQAIEMFEKLKKHIGENVTCKAFWYGAPYDEQGVLKEVNYLCTPHCRYNSV